jgi:hypothetical protein
MTDTIVVHPRYGAYTEPADPEVEVDVERMASHPAARGRFVLEDRLAPGSVWRLHATARPDLHVDVADRPDAEFIGQALNLALAQLQEGLPALGRVDGRTAPRTTVQRAAALGAERADLQHCRARLEAESGSGNAAANAHPVSGAAEAVRHDAITARLDAIARELAALEEA